MPWGVAKIKADEAWENSQGEGVKVAVIDTGIDRDHPDLDDNLFGCVNLISYPWWYRFMSCEDDNGHGTHVAGIIGAENNDFGVVGVAPKVQIYALKVLDRNGSGYLSDVIAAMDWSIEQGMAVINMSLSTASDILSFQEAVVRVEAAGIVQVAAAGNSGPGSSTVEYPARYPQVIAAAALSEQEQVPSWSSRGPELDLAAPGVAVYSTYRNGGYEFLSGTSMSAPHVTGVVALRLEDHPEESPSMVKSALISTADSLPYGPTLVGAGLVNALAVVSAP